ncbi:aminotransferase class I/II-fold pyridoxal phosphate-dependent enzyme [Demequina pelophila]|uniref:aminotransferase class I/II-fold pyridoxal phosphate-dependent enzyme n=1 Tax=Demequina pelophila TaxID=1638984 RepID=UPI000785BB4E|nr:aminotransferase class I/II-fold pyridoxal phosphate-dependent enzyme [Demequina pelophila]
MRARGAQEDIAKVTAFFDEVAAATQRPGVVDLTFGNPHEPPLEGLVGAIRAAVEPRTDEWFAYTTSQPSAQEAIAAGLTRELGAPFAPADIALTQGAFGAIELALHLLTEPGDEVIIPVPGWFCYPPMLRTAGLTPVAAALEPPDFDLDVEAILAAVTARTRIVIVNSPHNPTGRVYPRAQLEAVARALDEASARIGRRIWLLSDEPYRRLVYGGTSFVSPATVYPWSLIDYSYGKVLLAPGQRLGYLALGPALPDEDRADLAGALFTTQLAIGWGFPDAVMQYAVPELEHVSIDVAALERRRDLAVPALRAAGIDAMTPESTFYVWARAPRDDGDAFARELAARGVLVMPGSLFERPGWFRISLTATADMLERALPVIAEVAAEA